MCYPMIIELLTCKLKLKGVRFYVNSKYKKGDKAYFIESNCRIREVQILNYSGGIYLIRFDNGGGIRVNEHRLYNTKEEAERILPKSTSPEK